MKNLFTKAYWKWVAQRKGDIFGMVFFLGAAIWFDIALFNEAEDSWVAWTLAGLAVHGGFIGMILQPLFIYNKLKRLGDL